MFARPFVAFVLQLEKSARSDQQNEPGEAESLPPVIGAG